MYNFDAAIAAMEANDVETIAIEKHKALEFALRTLNKFPPAYRIYSIGATYANTFNLSKAPLQRQFVRLVTDEIVAHFGGFTYSDPKQIQAGDVMVIQSSEQYLVRIVTKVDGRKIAVKDLAFCQTVEKEMNVYEAEISKPTRKNFIIGVRANCGTIQPRKKHRGFIFMNF